MMMMSRNNRTMRLLRWQSLVVLCFCPITVVQALWLPTIFFGTDFAPESLLDDAPWIFRGGPVTLPVTLEECWAIVTDDASTQYWVSVVLFVYCIDVRSAVLCIVCCIACVWSFASAAKSFRRSPSYIEYIFF